MIILTSKPINKTQILDQALSLYKKTFWVSLPYTLIASLFTFGPQIPTLINHTHIEEYPLDLAESMLCLVGSLFFLSALIFRMYCYCYNVPSHFLSSLKQSFFKLISLLLLIVLYSLIILSGTMLLIVPGFIFAVYLMFGFILVITDNQSVLQTLISSYRLVTGQWWHTTIVMSIPILFVLILSLLCFIFNIGLSHLIGLQLSILYLLMFLTNIIIQIIMIPFTFATALILLHDLRQRQIISHPRWNY